ncbi:MAG: hypothetical protein RL616_1540 [Verrucomicrobiota bacterium]
MIGSIPFRDEDFPGYADSVARENLIRNAACLGINEVICGGEVKPLTAYHVRRLSFCGSPFLGRATAEQLCADEANHPWLLHHAMLFLWIISPFYQDTAKISVPPKRKWLESKKKFNDRCEAALTPRDKFNAAFARVMKCRLDDVIREILGYLDEAYLDAEEGEADDGQSYFAFEIAIAQELHSNYPTAFDLEFWNPVNSVNPVKNALFVPLKIIFQLRKARLKAKGEVVENKSERAIREGLAELGRRRRRTAEYEQELHRETRRPATGNAATLN